MNQSFFEDAVSVFCDKYCRFPLECKSQDELDKHCDNCDFIRPINEWLIKEYDHETDKNIAEYIVDYLIKNGVILIPDWCVIGDWIYWICPAKTGCDWVREKIIAYGENGFFHQEHDCPLYFTRFEEFGKTVFLTKEEAEKALRGEGE